MPLHSYTAYFQSLLIAQLPSAGLAWLTSQLDAMHTEKDFFLAFSRAPRFVGKHLLQVAPPQLAQANQLRSGFNPESWTADQAVRTLLLLHAPHQSPTDYTAILNRLFTTADLTELTTLYAALPLLPHPESHVKRAAEGVRTTMTQVFDAIALNNPYPHDFLPTEAWNQMILKAVFNVRPLHRIYGLDQRHNAALAQMLIDYAHERWAAGRTLTPEVWRLVSPYLTVNYMPDIQRLLQSANTLEKEAAALALTESDLPIARELLNQHPEIKKTITEGAFTWQSIGERAYAA
ncbi:EboA domain-containing protein [Hymenobacter sp. BT730]|uniref:EboA domain-containing protein n=1 Tax=Hymenobacter sp. BT730 TaxID=3063332 RepID=UPI0026DFB224|nr:EboA domain-containing protein [Hymenobacter sp. BT730]